MIKYGLDSVTELRFQSFQPIIERRDGQWVDITLRFELAPETEAPGDLIDFSALVICTADGTIVQMVPHDEGCDCEYQFTVSEKEQIAAFINQPSIQSAIQKLSSQT
ncbi:hypothetical protein L1N85_07425 [Paenibacillus alkaliterrae]|uniref:hypothetical protein n=1 Tax=Paenibacillus alkaliterrae TaxID=320909 RepID=UPI001F44E70E|nr:hypothetical protein [Paenibacillus alkaliterrae]MCF2938263.1 hypothetical protein [Paenibacillus alkaliterrae]